MFAPHRGSVRRSLSTRGIASLSNAAAGYVQVCSVGYKRKRVRTKQPLALFAHHHPPYGSAKKKTQPVGEETSGEMRLGFGEASGRAQASLGTGTPSVGLQSFFYWWGFMALDFVAFGFRA